MAKWKCYVCAHLYDEYVEDTDFEDLPYDWVCPACGVDKDNFTKISD